MAKIGIITTWYGKDVEGGAEKQAYEMAHRLNGPAVEVHVLTTCLQSFHHDWNKDFHKPGDYIEEGLRVLRFATGKRNFHSFDHVVGKMLKMDSQELIPGRYAASELDESIYWRNGIHSPDLLRHVRRYHHEYDYFILLPYLFPVVADATIILGKKALLQSCLHDEPYAYLRKVENSFFAAGKLLFNSQGELELAKEIFGNWVEEKSIVVGEGIDLHEMNLADLIDALDQQPSPVENAPFALYLGKKCEEKNTPFAIEAFAKYKAENPSSQMHLLLAGPAEVEIPAELKQSVRDLGLVPEEQKRLLLRKARTLLIPSKNESFSRVLFEALAVGTPVVVHGDCLATRLAVESSQQAIGFVASIQEEWIKCLGLVEALSEKDLADLAISAMAFSEKNASWSYVVEKYQNIVLGSKSKATPFQCVVKSPEPLQLEHYCLTQALNWSGIPCEWQPADDEVLSVRSGVTEKGLPLSSLPASFHSEMFQNGTLNAELFTSFNDDSLHLLYVGDEEHVCITFEKQISKYLGRNLHCFVFNQKIQSGLQAKGVVASVVDLTKFATYLYLSDFVVLEARSLEEQVFWENAVSYCDLSVLKIVASDEVEWKWPSRSFESKRSSIKDYLEDLTPSLSKAPDSQQRLDVLKEIKRSDTLQLRTLRLGAKASEIVNFLEEQV